MPGHAEGALVLGAYLLGSIPFALLLGKARGVDIREHGSGNIGATNLGRVLGRPWAIAAFALDFAKGLAPVLAARGLPAAGSPPAPPYLDLEVAAALAAVLGHLFPVYLRFRGGKGVATTFGAMTGLVWMASASAAIAWGAIFFASRTVSVASLGAALAFPLGVWLSHWGQPLAGYGGKLVFAGLVAALIVLRHRTNIVRLLRGEELRFAKRDGPSGGRTP